MQQVCTALLETGFSAELIRFSALDKYFCISQAPLYQLATNADLGTLARLFEDIRYPGVDMADAALDLTDSTVYLYCKDEDTTNRPKIPLLELSWNAQNGYYLDPYDSYPQLCLFQNRPIPAFFEDHSHWWYPLAEYEDRYEAIMDAALILSRYDSAHGNDKGTLDSINTCIQKIPVQYIPSTEIQKAFLSLLLSSLRPDYGLHLLKITGFIAEIWPELDTLDKTDHAKEYHPEGNVWVHTLETFQYRKKPELVLSLALLLHDIGKPLAETSGTRRFDKHAEIGAAEARRFLTRLNFDQRLIDSVCFLIRNHMMPAALPRLPYHRVREKLQSPLFPTLMELYRCDESSSFKGLDGYYESSAVYQQYRRFQKNPYRSGDGKKRPETSNHDF